MHYLTALYKYEYTIIVISFMGLLQIAIWLVETISTTKEYKEYAKRSNDDSDRLHVT